MSRTRRARLVIGRRSGSGPRRKSRAPAQRPGSRPERRRHPRLRFVLWGTTVFAFSTWSNLQGMPPRSWAETWLLIIAFSLLTGWIASAVRLPRWVYLPRTRR